MTKNIRFIRTSVFGLALCLLSVPVASPAIVISNGIPQGQLNHWSVDVGTGGETRTALVTAHRFASGDIFTDDVVFEYLSFVAFGAGPAVTLSERSFSGPVQVGPNAVQSEGAFGGANNNIIFWTATSTIAPGSQVMTTLYMFDSFDADSLADSPVGRAFGPLRFSQYLDEDADVSPGDDLFGPAGAPNSGDLRLFTFDNTQVYGVNQSGAFIVGSGLVNGAFAGWAAGQFPLMSVRIANGGQSIFFQGVIDDGLPFIPHPQLGTAFGPRDITSVLAWDLNPNAGFADITTSLGGVAQVLPQPLLPAAAQPSNPQTPIRCTRPGCDVSVACNLPQVQGTMCDTQVDLLVRRPRRSGLATGSRDLSEGLSAKAPRMTRLAFGVQNIPPGQTEDVRLTLTPRGKKIVRTSRKRRLRGVIEIRNLAGAVLSTTPIRIRLR